MDSIPEPRDCRRPRSCSSKWIQKFEHKREKSSSKGYRKCLLCGNGCSCKVIRPTQWKIDSHLIHKFQERANTEWIQGVGACVHQLHYSWLTFWLALAFQTRSLMTRYSPNFHSVPSTYLSRYVTQRCSACTVTPSNKLGQHSVITSFEPSRSLDTSP